MSFTNWFRRLFAPANKADPETAPPDYMVGAPGVSGFAALEGDQAAEGVEEETVAPSDPAP